MSKEPRKKVSWYSHSCLANVVGRTNDLSWVPLCQVLGVLWLGMDRTNTVVMKLAKSSDTLNDYATRVHRAVINVCYSP